MALSTAQMARMNQLLDEALDLDEAGRRRWLAALGEEDCDLEGALRAALLPHDQTDGALATLPKLPPDLSAEPCLQPGARVGPYELERPVGRGGMAQVWLAKRADGAYEREVALKLPVAFHLRGDVAKRFARERDILAGLEHPGIARFYDAGIGSDGLPYFAMEYVAGQSLTSWCDGQRLGIPDRLKLFLQVLDAVQYAHERGVLHRDIKPSNVLVTEAGQVRLLDFGVARMFQHTDTGLTMEYGRALTPEYASPEQMGEGKLNAASDVYSLGVLLYELLCGARPYRLDGGKLPAELPAVERPSTRVDAEAASVRMQTPPRLTSTLRGDLDAIVMKALSPESQQRYSSAQALAEDLKRYLERRPVLARPATLSYRTGKFLLRNRAITAATALGLTVAALGLGHAYTLQERRAMPALAISDKSIAVLPFVDMSEHHDQEYFSDGLSEELIDRLSHSPDLKVISRTSSFSFKGKNDDIRTIAAKLGVASLLEGSVRKDGNALRITAQLIRAADGTHLWSKTYDRGMSGIFRLQDEIAESVAQALNTTLKVVNRQTDSRPSNTEAYNRLLQGNYLFDRENKDDNQRAIEFYKEAIDLEPGYAIAWVKLSSAYQQRSGRGWAPIKEGYAQARDAIERALRIDPDLAEAHRNLGWIRFDFDWDWAGAKAELERAKELDPRDDKSAIGFAVLNAMQSGNLDEVIALEKKKLSAEPLNTRAMFALAYDFMFSGRLQESLDMWNRLRQLSPEFAGSRKGAITLALMGRYQEALDTASGETDECSRLFEQSIVYASMQRRGDLDTAFGQLKAKCAGGYAYQVAETYAYMGDRNRALDWLDRAYDVRDGGMSMLRIDPFFKTLQREPRFQAMLVKMNLVD